ncbi:MAG TPA: hypothetical protein ENI87_15315 [bacterium]|nr:hypothetical protein [bacterium]
MKSRRGRAKKKGLGPVKALAILLFCGGIAVWRLLPMLGGQPRGVPDTGSVPAAPEGLGVEDEVTMDAQEAEWSDLLAVYGSFDDSEPVRLAFSVLAGPDVNAAPLGETAHGSASVWVGEDPPLQRLGVVMVSDRSRRAVFGGAVVGVGDEIAGGRVVAIEPGQLRLDWHGRELTYDLDDVAPREFRAERRRRAEQAAEENDGASVNEIDVEEEPRLSEENG